MFILYVLFILATVDCARVKNDMILKGTWTNELGSYMNIDNVTLGGDTTTPYQNTFSGWYNSKVGEASGLYPLYGTFNYQNGSTSIGFNVVYSNRFKDSGSNAVWTGQLLCKQHQVVIHTAWLVHLYSKKNLPWDSTLVGRDTFVKQDDIYCEF